MDRIRLELEGAQSDKAALEGQISEMQRTNTDLRRQVDKWKKLEGKGDQDAKAKLNLEVEKGELEGRLREFEKKEKASTKETRKIREQLNSLQVCCLFC